MQANILQPLTHVGTLSMRYDAVEELLASEELLVDVAQGLLALPRDLDKVCRGLVGIQNACAVGDVRLASAVTLCLAGKLLCTACLGMHTVTHTIAARETFFGV